MTTFKRKGGQPPKDMFQQLSEGQWGYGGGGGRYGSIGKKSTPKSSKKSTVKKDAAVAAAIAIPTAAVLSKDAIIKDVKKGIKKVKGLFKKPKSDLGSPGDRKGYPHE